MYGIFSSFADGSEFEVFIPLPIGSLRALRLLSCLSERSSVLVLSSDNGFDIFEELFALDGLPFTVYGGAASGVNFDAIGKYSQVCARDDDERTWLHAQGMNEPCSLKTCVFFCMHPEYPLRSGMQSLRHSRLVCTPRSTF